MRALELVRELQATGKEFFTLADLEKATGLEGASLRVALNRLSKRGVLERASDGVYIVPGSAVNVERVAGQLYFPSYLSFESALSRFGVLNLVPFTLTFATIRKTKSIDLLHRQVAYRHIKKDLFFGFDMKDGVYVAEPEKALLDLVYLATFGKAALPLEEMDFSSLSMAALEAYASRFPPRVGKRIEGLF